MADYRFGKHPPKVDYRTLRFSNYLKPGIAAPPTSYDVLKNVYAKVKTSDPAKLFPIDGNDTKSDCTIAALAHAETIYKALLDTETIMSQTAVLKLYFHLTGGIDSGLNELDVLNYWRQHSVSGGTILNYVSINPKNHTHVQQAINLLNGVYLGFQVQENCQQDFHDHKPWTPGKLTNDGHAVYAVAYDQTGVTVLTWGNVQQATWAWWDECVDEAYAILPSQAKETGYAPGVDLAQLEKDLSAVAS